MPFDAGTPGALGGSSSGFGCINVKGSSATKSLEKEADRYFVKSVITNNEAISSCRKVSCFSENFVTKYSLRFHSKTESLDLLQIIFCAYHVMTKGFSTYPK